jgi:hypothetical protein
VKTAASQSVPVKSASIRVDCAVPTLPTSVLARIDPLLLARNDPDGKHDLRS